MNMEIEYYVEVRYNKHYAEYPNIGFDTWEQADNWIDAHEFDYPGHAVLNVKWRMVRESIPDCDYAGIYRT